MTDAAVARPRTFPFQASTLITLVMIAVTGSFPLRVLAQKAPPVVPSSVPQSKVVRAAVDDDLLTDAERDAQRIFHGLLDEVSDSAKSSAAFALARWDLNNPLLAPDHQATAPLLRAEAALRRGDFHQIGALLAGDDSPRAVLLRGRALAGLGQFDKAVATFTSLREATRNNKYDTAADITAAAEAAAELAMLEGRGGEEYQLVLGQYDRATQQADRLYWPAHLAAGELLMSKDNPQQALKSLQAALVLNPMESSLWFSLGRIALRGYDFDSVNKAVFKLRQIQPTNVLADILAAEMYLQQRDADMAQRTLIAALLRYPNQRDLLALSAAAAALDYKPDQTAAALAAFDAVSPGHPLAYFVTGRYLSLSRQYDYGANMLAESIRRQPNWSAPQVELGLLLNQAGREAESLAVLRGVTRLDPFNIRAANVLKMLEALAGYHTIETDHFIVKFGDEIDGALARDMPELLEQIYTEVTAAFSHKPRVKTLIEIMPDKQYFAVRITGMPDIWTIAASTGSVVALTPPRIGKKQAGPFDWYRVIRHEFVHTVTLDQTDNRIPHWFTEACAVSQEPGPRDYDTCQLLAMTLLNDELFDMDEINWGFVRPRKPTDRALAYAQAHWMFEYITQRFGHRTILKMLSLSKQGAAENRIVPEATGQTADEFMSGFKQWAHQQIRDWGLNPTPPRREVMQKLRDGGDNTQQNLDALLKQHPDHPDLLRVAAENALDRGEDKAAYSLLLRYASVRPVDPWADARIAELAVKLGRPNEAVSHLEQLDRLDQHTGAHAQTLMEIYRRGGQLDEAQVAAQRVLIRQPYDPAMRETAAAIALQRGDMETALRHIQALTVIEPDQSIHFTRLAALYHKMSRPAEANAAAEKARELNPGAPVDAFLK